MATWYNAQWTNRQRIDIDHTNVEDMLFNFIMFIDHTGLDRPGSNNDLFDKARIDGRDIVVCNSDGVTKLEHELVSFDATNKKIELYVKIPIISQTESTRLYIYYGNSAHIEPNSNSLWSDYQYVTHNGGIRNAKTDTAGSVYGTATIVEGLAGSAFHAVSTGDIIDTGLFRINYPMTMQVMVKPVNVNAVNVLGMWKGTANDMFLYQTSGQWVFEIDNGGGVHNFGQVHLNQWNHLAISVDNVLNSTYQDGEFIGGKSSGNATGYLESGNSLKINDIGDFFNSSGGYQYDEIRIFNGVLPSEYLAAEYLNFNNPSAFYTVTPEESVSGVYLEAALSIVTGETFEPSISIGVRLFQDTVSYLPFESLLGTVNTGTLVEMPPPNQFPITSYHMSVQALEQALGLNVSFGSKDLWAGASRFKPIKPFELFKELEGDKNKDSRFLSGVISETITMGGVVCYIWLLEGTFEQVDNNGRASTQLDEGMGEAEDGIMSLFGIQDAILGENRDRSYSKDCYRMKGTYAVSQNELDFARFGIMMNNDIIQLEMHKGDMERICGRRLVPGDIVEMPHLREVGLQKTVVNKYYQVDNVTKSPSGYDHTYNYHILALTLRPVVDAHEFIDIMERTDEYDNTIGSQLGNRDAMEALTEKIQQAAAEQANTTGWDITPLYIDDENNVFAHKWSADADAPNGKPVPMVSSFPQSPNDGDYVCRIDHFPNRLYRFQQGRWLLKEIDNKRDWQPYNWTRKLRDFATDRSLEDDMRPWEYKSVHDILTPRQGRSTPSPKGHDITAVEIFDFDRKLKVEVPDIAVADPVIRSATLNPQTQPTIISDHLNGASGQYNYFLIYYVLKQGTNQQTGEMMITDDGNNTSMDHEWTTIGTLPINFTVDNTNGIRRLRYTLTGSQTVEMQYYVEAKWSLDD